MLIFITSVFKFLAAACMCAIETHLPQPDGRHQTLPLDEGASCHNPRHDEGASTLANADTRARVSKSPKHARKNQNRATNFTISTPS